MSKETDNHPLAEAKVDVAPPTPSNGSKYVDKFGEGQREGNRRNVAATLAAAVVTVNGYDTDKAIEVYEKIHGHLVSKDNC